ncbi:MAG: hypothetical protein ACTSRG_23265 [Candidatus Helarchaeota archaeon]
MNSKKNEEEDWNEEKETKHHEGQKLKFSMEEMNNWRKWFHKPENALEWKSTGIFSPKEAWVWSVVFKIPIKNAITFAKAGFTPRDTAVWLANGFNDPLEIKYYTEVLGFIYPYKAKEWKEIELPKKEIWQMSCDEFIFFIKRMIEPFIDGEKFFIAKELTKKICAKALNDPKLLDNPKFLYVINERSLRHLYKLIRQKKLSKFE